MNRHASDTLIGTMFGLNYLVKWCTSSIGSTHFNHLQASLLEQRRIAGQPHSSGARVNRIHPCLRTSMVIELIKLTQRSLLISNPLLPSIQTIDMVDSKRKDLGISTPAVSSTTWLFQQLNTNVDIGILRVVIYLIISHFFSDPCFRQL